MSSTEQPQPQSSGDVGDEDKQLKHLEATDIAIESFSPAVEAAIEEVLPSEDPLDKTGFDPVQFINQNFPDEMSLQRLDPFAKQLKHRIKALDAEIFDAIQEQATTGRRTATDIDDAKKAIEGLFQKVSDIKAKAEESEVMVEEVCRDIRQLDAAKKHLTTTITALRQLSMMVTAIEQLTTAAKKCDYDTAAKLLAAVNSFSAHFENYGQVPRVAELMRTVREHQENLKDRIFDEFRSIGVLGNDIEITSQEKDSLQSACLVVDAMGYKTKKRLFRVFLDDQLRAYDALFGRGGEGFALERAEQRFPYFRRMLRELDETCGGIFPIQWRIDHKLALRFAEKTRDHLASVLSDQSDVPILVKSLQKTILWEKEMRHRFSKYTAAEKAANGTGMNGAGGGDEDDEDDEDETYIYKDDEGNPIDPKSAAGIRKKYEHRKKKREAREAAKKRSAARRSVRGALTGSGAAGDGGVDKEEEEEEKAALARNFVGLVSSVFEPYMVAYVALETKNMNDLVTDLSKEEGAGGVDRSGNTAVLKSSFSLFLFIKEAVKRCCAISNAHTLFLLYKEFKACLGKYAKLLLSRLPKAQTNKELGDHYVVATDAERDYACFAINTAAYCADTVPGLGEMIRTKIEAAYVDHIDMDDEADAFYDVIGTAIKVLVSGFVVNMEPMLRKMQKMPWESWAAVGDQSDYMRQLSGHLHEAVPPVAKLVSSVYFSNFCDRLASKFLPRFTWNIFRCKRISDMGAQQLLLDTHALKTVFKALPDMGRGEGDDDDDDEAEDDGGGASRTYVKMCEREIGQTERILKLLATPVERLAASFELLWAEGTGEDLVRVMTLKGVKAAEQKEILSELGLSYDPRAASALGPSSRSVLPGGAMAAPAMAKMADDLQNKFEGFSKMFKL